MNKIVFITGPTASGKSELAMRAAEKWGGAIVCADSQTVRRGMDIGTAKPTDEDRKRVPHHVLDIIDPYERFTVADFVRLAERAIDDIAARGKLPIVVGGTGLYIDALLYGFSFRPSVSKYSRVELEAKSVSELQAIITEHGYALPENDQNPRHLIRIIESKGQRPTKRTLRARAVVVGVDPGKAAHDQRIMPRVEAMLDAGLVTEVRTIIKKYGEPTHGFDAIQYRIVYENPHASAEQLKEKLAVGDRQYAKKQRAWMKRNTDIIWFSDVESAFSHLESVLN